ncbi:glyoxylate reductase/hydroxypyruvate reductase-like [Rhizophagus clarus]|uniref:Glyoxylate reductase/hydroxypyruvate reductase-like n=1 Tax=Rhizophagus clarus TaxID=94130 RepID=A0A8H3M335_9GLOM|nr:glyoxylate reductase/hydroxypyruvate reductase-like [Rhizophagus clarus]
MLEFWKKLIESAKDVELVCWDKTGAIPREKFLEMAKGVDGIICMLTEKIDSELLNAAGPNLKVVSTVSVGYDHVDLNELRKRSILLGHTPGVLTDAVADITVLLVLAAARRIREGIRAVESGKWTWSQTWMLGVQFTNKTVGIVGLGRIGSATALRLKPFIGDNGKIIYFGRVEKPIASSLGATKVEFDTLILFKKMKSNVILVNTARGGIIRQDDLCRALSEGMLGSVGLDVMTPEPLNSNDPLLKFDRVIVIPHIGSATLETRTLMANLAIENVLSGVRGETLPHGVKMKKIHTSSHLVSVLHYLIV